jgi:hypothetical protein
VDGVRDVADVVEALERYEEDEGRRLELLGVTVDEAPITFEEAGAYLVGVAAARLARPKPREVLGTPLNACADEWLRACPKVAPANESYDDERRSSRTAM